MYAHVSRSAAKDNFAGSVCAGICGYRLAWEVRRGEMEGASWWVEV